MKRFKTISTTFIVVIAVIFSCNVYYLVSLYNSIRSNVERDGMTALADADIDDLMFRAGRAQALASNVQMQEEVEEKQADIPIFSIICNHNQTYTLTAVGVATVVSLGRSIIKH